MARAAVAQSSLITSARVGASLSTDQRARRYLVTMVFRVVCFLAGIAAPTPWNVVLFVAAALLPGIAVLLGNARDNRPSPHVLPDEDAPRLALTGGEVIPGDVEADAPTTKENDR